jgi:hypothetical protein
VLSASRLMSALRTYLSGGSCDDCRYFSRGIKRSGRCLFSAKRTQVQKSRGLLSPSSRETQASRGLSAGSDCPQLASKVVLPKPAGAETSVREHLRPSLSKVVRRGRAIKICEVAGTKNLVATSWFWKSIDVLVIASCVGKYLCLLSK